MADILGRLTTALTHRYAIERELGASGMATVYRSGLEARSRCGAQGAAP